MTVTPRQGMTSADARRSCSWTRQKTRANAWRRMLKRDYRVLRAASGEAAPGLMDREGVDLVLADVDLPGVTGFDFLRSFARTTRWPKS